MSADKTLRDLYGKMKQSVDEFNAYAEKLAGVLDTQAPFLPITPGWYETRGMGKLEVLKVIDHGEYPVVVAFDPDKDNEEAYHADGMMCHNTGEQSCDLVARTTAPEGGGS